jgi:steroid 5-alpha reductase family enzyme
VVLNSPAVSDLAGGGSNPAFGTAPDIIGIVIWAVGLIIESVSDTQKVRSRSRCQNREKKLKKMAPGTDLLVTPQIE